MNDKAVATPKHRTCRGYAMLGNNEGFTLIEVLVTTVILSVGLMAMMTLQYTAIRMNARAGQISAAAVVAERGLETVKMTPYDDVTISTFADEDYGDIAGNPRFKRSYTIQNSVPGTGRKTITVTTAYKDRTGTERTVSLSTIVRDN